MVQLKFVRAIIFRTCDTWVAEDKQVCARWHSLETFVRHVRKSGKEMALRLLQARVTWSCLYVRESKKKNALTFSYFNDTHLWIFPLWLAWQESQKEPSKAEKQHWGLPWALG